MINGLETSRIQNILDEILVKLEKNVHYKKKVKLERNSGKKIEGSLCRKIMRLGRNFGKSLRTEGSTILSLEATRRFLT